MEGYEYTRMVDIVKFLLGNLQDIGDGSVSNTLENQCLILGTVLRLCCSQIPSKQAAARCFFQTTSRQRSDNPGPFGCLRISLHCLGFSPVWATCHRPKDSAQPATIHPVWWCFACWSSVVVNYQAWPSKLGKCLGVGDYTNCS